MVDVLETFFYILNHNFVLLSSFHIDGVSFFSFLNILFLVLLFNLFVVTSGLPDGLEVDTLFVFVDTPDVVSGYLSVENLIAFVLP